MLIITLVCKFIYFINYLKLNHVNKLLLLFSQASRRVDDLFEDLRDGHNLLSLLEVLSGEHLVRLSDFMCV